MGAAMGTAIEPMKGGGGSIECDCEYTAPYIPGERRWLAGFM